MRAAFFTAALTAGAVASAATLTKVNYPNNTTSKVDMYIYVPDKVVENPPLVIVIHSCQSTAQTYFQNSKIPWKQGSDKKGYISKPPWRRLPSCPICSRVLMSNSYMAKLAALGHLLGRLEQVVSQPRRRRRHAGHRQHDPIRDRSLQGRPGTGVRDGW